MRLVTAVSAGVQWVPIAQSAMAVTLSCFMRELEGPRKILPEHIEKQKANVASVLNKVCTDK